MDRELVGSQESARLEMLVTGSSVQARSARMPGRMLGCLWTGCCAGRGGCVERCLERSLRVELELGPGEARQ